MLQLWNAKYISPVLTGLAVIIVFSSFFGVASRVKATEVRHPTHQHDQGDWLVPTGKGWGQFDSSGMSFFNAQKYAHGPGGGKSGGGGSTNNGILYHGGRVITAPDNPHMYYIWYGSWISGDNTMSILDSFGNEITHDSQNKPRPYFNINATYYNADNKNVSGKVDFTDLGIVSTDSKYGSNNGTSLSDNDIQAIVEDKLKKNNLTLDPNGVYFVLTSADINESSGFCTMYCAWHGYGATSTNDTILVGFIGDPAACPLACSAVTSGNAPHDDLAADSMANLLAHELAEATTDPTIAAWYDRRGRENADKCAWKFGSTNSTSDGKIYNVTWSTSWLLQQNWINAGGGYCTLAN
jgi:hypothetical protein